MNDLTLYEKVPVEEKNFPITLLQSNTKSGLAAHWHEHLELLYFKTGGCRMTCGGESFEVSEDDLIVVNCNELHFFDKSETGSYFCIMINPSFFSDVDFENFLIKPIIHKDKIAKECFEKMFMEKYTGEVGSDMEIKSHAYRLLAHILRTYKVERMTENELLIRKNRIKRISDILRYISEHYSNKMTTSSLAERFYLNEHYFCHFFKDATGLSPISYINRYRIEKAAVLLENTGQSVTEIAMNVGFEDANYFSRTFKKYMGVQPKEYKLQKTV